MKNLNRCRINVMVSDMNTAIEFYTGTLGLELLNRYGDYYAEIQAPGLMIGLHPRSEKTVQGTNMSIGLGVFKFDETITDLRQKGIEFKIEDEGFVRLAYFSDADGNLLFLAENK